MPKNHRKWAGVLLLMQMSLYLGRQCLGTEARASSSLISTGTSLCGVKLRSQAVAVQKYVEGHFRHPVECTVQPGLTSSGSERGHVDLVSGVPTVTLDSIYGVNEITLTHELFHLKFAADGLTFSGVEFVIVTTARSKQLSQSAKNFLGTMLYSYLQHRLFFPKMVAMGLNPYSEINGEIEHDLITGQQPGNAKNFPEFMTVMVLLALDESSERPRAEGWYKKNGWNQQLQTAIAMHDLITARDPKAQKDLLSTTQDCLNMLFPLI